LKKNNIKIKSNRSFGIVFFIVFLIISFIPLISDNDIRIWLRIISIIFLILGLINSSFLTFLNKTCFKFRIFLGNFVSLTILSIIFFLVVTPTSLLMKLFGKDLLSLKRNNEKSYWIERPKIKSKMKNQF
tara:strand:- start:42 stop:431 length:390 start_codon:yes stop_codon:yes gene_type:complete